MRLKAAYYKSATFAALVVASSIALLTGAQADTLNFSVVGPTGAIGRCCGVGFSTVPGQDPTGQTGQMQWQSQSSTLNAPTQATLDGLTGSWSLSTPSTGSGITLSAIRNLISGFDPATSTFNTIGPTLSGPAPGSPVSPTIFSLNFGANGSMTGDINLTSVQDNISGNTFADARTGLNGIFTVTDSSGALASIFGPPGSTATFTLPLALSSQCSIPVVGGSCPFTLFGPSGLFGLAQSNGNQWSTPNGVPGALAPLNVVPLPPAIYLFGSTLGGALWLGRRKRRAVSIKD